ncbi:MAG: hypothetical protein HY829_04800, partial [Actinobacteria bacterium]|nr:hypothetical protein [Actinomycetota bacterium]
MEQPYLHELSVVLAAPQQCWSRRDGQIVESPVQGVYCADVRVASTVTLTADGPTNEHIGTVEPGGGTARFDTVWRTPELGADPAVVCRRERTLTSKGLYERVVVRSTAPHDLRVPLTLVVAPDSAPMSAVRASLGSEQRPVPAPHDDGTYTWRFGQAGEACLVAPGSFVQVATDRIHATWDLEVPARGEVSVQWRLLTSDPGFPFVHSPVEHQPETAGTCVLVAGAPRGAREPCQGEGACGGVCDGTDV